ncbi:MAG: hypothetical protein LBN95_01120 [Prevotellaceae bacterium]|jgi:hypothetical protein|nr:hypothetical protein [Prevotellaceae bacterium]
MRWAEICLAFSQKGCTDIASSDCCLKGKFNLAQWQYIGFEQLLEIRGVLMVTRGEVNFRTRHELSFYAAMLCVSTVSLTRAIK